MNFHGSNPKRWLGYAAVALALSGVGCAIAASGVPQEQSEFFEKRIRPLFIENCLECHGEKKQKGGLRLDVRDGWVHGGDSGPALVPQQPEKSLIYHAVRYGDKKLEMPPKGRLSASQIEDIRQWIQMGAPDPRISIPITRQPKNQMSLEKGRSFWSLQPLREPSVPHVGDTEWSVHPIDAFIRQSQIQKDIHPAPGADAYALVRRLYIDLIGLPPTPAEIQEFVSDPSEHAWEMLVDQLLASKHFGERWGRHWLDVARYAESSGGGRTLMFPEAWRYRDYVIEAFNQDMPYDQFIQEQLAGDLMESDTWMEAQRRLTATGFLLLGPTNYELQDKDILEMDIIDEQLDTIGKAFMGLTLGCARCHDHKFDPIPAADYYALAGIFKSTRVVEHDNVSTWATRQLPQDPVTQSAIDQKYSEIAALKSEISQLRKSIESEKKSRGSSAQNTENILNDLQCMVMDNPLAELTGNWVESNHTPGFVGKNYLHDNRAQDRVLAARFQFPQLKAGVWHALMSFTPGENRASAVPVVIGLADREYAFTVNQRQPGNLSPGLISLGEITLPDDGDVSIVISNEHAKDGHVIVDAVALTQRNPATWTPVHEAPQLEDLQNKLVNLNQRLTLLENQGPVRQIAMAVSERDEITNVPIAIRGVLTNRGPIVPRGALQVINSHPPPRIHENQSGRLELAQWITDPRHPLTSRVIANRVWAWLMSRGIVHSVDNFGTMGTLPTHPELLDFLAHELIRNHWSIKQLVRDIVLTRTYRLSSAHIESAYQADPSNSTYWRMPRRRLDAESIRDSILQLSQSLDFSYAGNNIEAGTTSEYGYHFNSPRRSVYLPVFRNNLPEIFETFDFADPNRMNGLRNSSAVAPQSLLLMNSPEIQSQCLSAAQCLLQKSELNPDQQITDAFLATLGRPPLPSEHDLIRSFLSQYPDPDSSQVLWGQIFQTLIQSIDFRYLK